MKLFFTIALWASLSAATPAPVCQADKCFPILKLNPPLAKLATTICQKLIRSTPPATLIKTATTTITTTTTPAAPINTITATNSITVTTEVVCTTTVTVAESLTTSYAFTQQHVVKKRQDLAFAAMGAGCSEKSMALTAKISKACSCFLTPTATTTATATVTSTSVLGTPPAVITTVTTIVAVTTQSCTSTVTSTVTNADGGGSLTCGAPVAAYTSGSISCNRPAPAGQTDGRLRIEGNDNEGTVFEGCIISGPHDVTTPSGGTHKCDGTNNGANPNPGTTSIGKIDDAAKAFGFTFDGSWSDRFQDFFITRINQADSTASGNQFWGVLQDRVFTPVGGCEVQARPGVEDLWAWNAFNVNYFLGISPQYASVPPGSSVTVTITGTNGDNGNANPISGAVLSGQGTSDGNGQVTFQAPTTRGCYVYKATMSNSVRSNAFYLSVF
ncbi:hypothetical protein B5807_12140 [Epicoccum nigrum]|uniref:Ig-like domain-containing protein n=1 Tax=Epicoccum nigrum TaxID=105696 RepID=A0A1Y2LGR7_EPING|nr:hypothetical protein B5807_12140 [Epicoccum nigrum]